MLRVCVIGLGPIGNLHADIYAKDDLAELVGVCDIVRARAEETGKRHGVPWYLDAARMLGELKPDICSVATGGFEYGSDHHRPVIQALETGCNVLCEKPISNELARAEEMVRAAEISGRCFAVDFNHRFTPASYTARRWMDEGLIGTPLFVNMALWIGRFTDPESEVYHLKALNPHSIDMMRHFCGEITSVHCFAMKAPGRKIWSTASINVQFANTAVGHLTSSYDIGRGHPMERCEVAGTAGRFVLEDMWREATLYPADGMEKRVYTNPVFGGYGGFNDTFAARLHSFLEEVQSGADPASINGSGADALKGLKVIFAAIESLNTGKAVDITY